MPLKRCSLFFGRRRLIWTPPSLRLARDAVFTPVVAGGAGGLFEPSGWAVPEAIEDAPPAHVIRGGAHHHFIGDINPHDGHFLVGAFARLWALPQEMRANCRWCSAAPCRSTNSCSSTSSVRS